MSVCDHDISERELACADGMCPLCMSGIINRLDTALQASESIKAGYLDEVERLRSAIRWALGEAPDAEGKWFGDTRPPLEARFWWRIQLRRMAALPPHSPPGATG